MCLGVSFFYVRLLNILFYDVSFIVDQMVRLY